ncbi:hypothetical protein [Coleofasciculus sp. FACHB-T130]|uniref:hypothetical protein n=1 Tax=Coleofasciculus sp. FACHB-T130 TaxID=2692792 RepID=UPI00199501B6|nr:hypothetical protein [Coleofasciculus sp. FACHB-T130]MBD1878649.1 hypothetical protein [Coleofasciculus sp. FACHB-T130]
MPSTLDKPRIKLGSRTSFGGCTIPRDFPLIQRKAIHAAIAILHAAMDAIAVIGTLKFNIPSQKNCRVSGWKTQQFSILVLYSLRTVFLFVLPFPQ